MSVVKLYSDNPKDGVTTFDKVRFYQADDSSGTNATLIATVSIDQTNISLISPGFTQYTYTSGSTSKYYASSWYNSGNLVETDKSSWVQGGQDRWDQMFMDEMRDTSSSVWSSTDRSYFKTKALEALFPNFFYETIDTTLTITNNNTNQYFSYTLPFGIFNISEVGVGLINNQNNPTTGQPFKIVKPDNWYVEQNNLIFNSLSNLTDTYTIRLVGSKKYQDVGEVPNRLDPLVMVHMRMSAYIWMQDDYTRFLKWVRLQQGTKVTFESLRLHVTNLERMYKQMSQEIQDTLGSVRSR